ncbi:MAG TPA: hypothetical protein P5081_05485 [Phycisphaerae bacterium]|nr:hypothetical protein [Phycisphaerae bacterium]HRW52319.1 hypothetical protein [Phycisphaerae bacterium]
MTVYYVLFVTVCVGVLGAAVQAECEYRNAARRRPATPSSTLSADTFECSNPYCSKKNGPKARFCAACGCALTKLVAG